MRSPRRPGGSRARRAPRRPGRTGARPCWFASRSRPKPGGFAFELEARSAQRACDRDRRTRGTRVSGWLRGSAIAGSSSPVACIRGRVLSAPVAAALAVRAEARSRRDWGWRGLNVLGMRIGVIGFTGAEKSTMPGVGRAVRPSARTDADPQPAANRGQGRRPSRPTSHAARRSRRRVAVWTSVGDAQPLCGAPGFEPDCSRAFSCGEARRTP